MSLLLVSCDQAKVEQNKELARTKLRPLIGEDWTQKILGSSPSTISLPPIPKVTKDATSLDVYKKDGQFDSQEELFQKLSLEEKRKYRLAFIQELYEVTRNAEPKDEDVLNFLNVLEQGGTREGVYRAIVLDSVYGSLESFEEAPSKELKEFAVDFGKTYLGRKFNSSAMGKLNLWSIKRIVVEKALEVMDVLKSRPDELKSWYAVLSADLAKRKKSIWKNDVRKQVSPEYHYQWASKVPLQQIKSETIIKLHAIMNELNK